MLEKIGLPAKPSLRGNTWVVDASHCQGCSSQFTFVNRKHHCRRCGGIFCNSCTQQRMILRGQGDSPVRICQPCKQLEEAARFEMRYGNKNRAPSRGSSKLVSKNDHETLNRILGNDTSSSGGSFSSLDGGGDVSATNAVDETDLSSVSPEELRKQALDEKKRYKILKGEGKSGEAMKAFKRGKELERQADALEISVRKSRRKVLSSGNMLETQSNDGSKDSGGKSRGLSQVGKEKDDLYAELRDLGWNDMDLHGEDKRSANMSLEGELSSLLGDVSQRANKDSANNGIGKAQVVEHKRKALMLKREGKLAEAKEELKKAKVLEKQLEEQEILGGAEDSDDEISALIRSMVDDKDDDLVDGYRQHHGFDLDHLMSTADNLDDKNLEVTDDDMMDPEIGAALKSLGWTDDSNNQQVGGFQSHPIEREALLHEIRSLKREALNQKQAGNVSEAMAQLKKAKLLERELESFEGGDGNMVIPNSSGILKGSVSQNIPQKKDVVSQFAPKNRLMIQKELLVLKKKALALRRDGRLDEAEEELRKGRVLEQELQEMDNATKAITAHQILEPDNSDSHEILPVMEGEEDVTDQDMRDPAYLSLLRTMGWTEDEESASSQIKHSGGNGSHSIEVSEPSAHNVTGSLSRRTSRKSKGEIQRELLALKRKALALRREGKTDEADEVLSSAKVLEFQMAETEAPLEKEIQVESKRSDGDNKFASTLLKPAKEYDHHSLKTMEPSITDASSGTPSITLRRKGELQRELLGLKKKALALRPEGRTDEAEDVLSSAKALETQMAEMEASRNATQVEVNRAKVGSADSSMPSAAEKGDADDVTDEDMINPAFLSVLKNLGWKEEASQPATVKVNASKNVSVNSVHSQPSVSSSPSSISTGTQRGKEVQQDEVGWKEDPTRNLRIIVDKLSSASDASHQAQGTHAETLTSSPENLGTRLNIAAKRVERVVTADGKLGTYETKSQGYASQNDQSTLQQEVLARKRKAVALKREGKLSEAREELRQAKLLEKSLEAENPNIEQGTSTATSTSVSNDSVPQKEIDTSKSATKPLSGRDRFKLQQESLSHKRQALKLRREGRMEEAEAEFEFAKALEVQLEETASQSSASSSAGIAEPVGDVLVEDLLDPQLLSALKSIGIADANTAPTGEERPAPVKVDLGKVEHDTKEKIQLEEHIKAEKIKAVNLKRAGKQAEALEAIRRAKLLGKKLNSLS